jgi:hypothetical protein
MTPLTLSLSPGRLCHNYYFVTLNLFQGLVTMLILLDAETSSA